LARLVTAWALIADALPIYPLYALLFVSHGVSRGGISILFAIWSAVSILVEVPTGALADRYSRRNCLVASGVLQAAGYACWLELADFTGYAVGFALWGLGGSLASGALQALLYDNLAAVGAEDHYARIFGRVTAAGLLGQIPAAVAATVLFAIGSYQLVMVVTVGLCLVAAAVATQLPEARGGGVPAGDAVEPGFLTSLRDGLAVVRVRPGVRAAVAAVAVLTGIDALEEYFPLLAHDWGVRVDLTPLAMVGIPLVGAAGAAMAGASARLSRPLMVAAVLGIAGLLLGVAGLLRQPVGLVAVAAFYGLYRLSLVVVDARLQRDVDSSSRATVSSIAGLGAEVAVFGVYAAWALGGVLLIAVLIVVVSFAMPWLLGISPRKSDTG
jgi:MFS family permease